MPERLLLSGRCAVLTSLMTLLGCEEGVTLALLFEVGDEVPEGSALVDVVD
jgi:hypothetical protein